MRKLQAFTLPLELETFTLPIPPDAHILGVYETIGLVAWAVFDPAKRGETVFHAFRDGDEDAFKGKLTELLSFVRSRGTRLGADQVTKSDVILPADDMSLAEAKDIMAAPPAS